MRSEGALGPLYVYSLFARWQQLATNKLIIIHSPDGRTPRYAHRNEYTRESDGFQAGIVEVVLGTEFLTIAPLTTLTGMNALQMDSEGSIVEVVLGTEFLTMSDEQSTDSRLRVNERLV